MEDSARSRKIWDATRPARRPVETLGREAREPPDDGAAAIELRAAFALRFGRRAALAICVALGIRVKPR